MSPRTAPWGLVSASGGLLSREGCPELLSLSPSARRRSLGWALVFPCPPPWPPSPEGVSASRSPLGHRRQAPITGPLHVCSLTAQPLPRSAFTSLLQVVFTWEACLPAHPILNRASRSRSSPLVYSSLQQYSTMLVYMCPSHAHPGAEAAPERPAPSLFTRPALLLSLPWRTSWGGISFFLLCWPRCPACDILVPHQGSNPCPLHWECRVLATRPPRKFQSSSVVWRNLYQLQMICSLNV